MTWDSPALFFLDLLWRYFVLELVVYMVLRNVIGYTLSGFRSIGK